MQRVALGVERVDALQEGEVIGTLRSLCTDLRPPALAPFVPWQPAQVLASMLGLRTPSAEAMPAISRPAAIP